MSHVRLAMNDPPGCRYDVTITITITGHDCPITKLGWFTRGDHANCANSQLARLLTIEATIQL